MNKLATKKPAIVAKKQFARVRVKPRPVSWSAPPFWEKGKVGKRGVETPRARAQRERDEFIRCAQLRRELRDFDPTTPMWKVRARELIALQEGLGLTPVTRDELVGEREESAL